MLLLDALLEGRLREWKLLGGRLHAIGLPEQGPYLAVSAETRKLASRTCAQPASICAGAAWRPPGVFGPMSRWGLSR